MAFAYTAQPTTIAIPPSHEQFTKQSVILNWLISFAADMAPNPATNGSATDNSNNDLKKKIIINAFDMSTIGHLSPGQWKVNTTALFAANQC